MDQVLWMHLYLHSIQLDESTVTRVTLNDANQGNLQVKGPKDS